MKYRTPKVNGKKYWVPVVVKNKDYLAGYLEGMSLMGDMIIDSLQKNGIEINTNEIELFLDSSRFNDILKDGRRESELSDTEKKKMLYEIIEEKMTRVKEHHVENNIENDDSVLSIECLCGYGFYSWETVYDIPDKKFDCVHCGRRLIDYTKKDDYEFEYDG